MSHPFRFIQSWGSRWSFLCQDSRSRFIPLTCPCSFGRRPTIFIIPRHDRLATKKMSVDLILYKSIDFPVIPQMLVLISLQLDRELCQMPIVRLKLPNTLADGIKRMRKVIQVSVIGNIPRSQETIEKSKKNDGHRPY